MSLNMLSRSSVAIPLDTIPASRPRVAQPLCVSARLCNVSSRIPKPAFASTLKQTVRHAAPAGPAVRGSVVARAELKYEVAPDNRDYAPVIGIIALVAHLYGQASLNASLLLKTVAVYQIGVAAIGLLFRRVEADSMASIVGPAILAVNTLALSQVSYMDAAIALFGYNLCENLEGPVYLWLATLAGAIYAGYPSQWYVGAFALWAAIRLVRGGQNNTVPVLTIPTLAAAAYAFWKDLTPAFTIALLLGQVGASALKYIEAVSDQ
mmetsp:Transcript_19644/g.59420  ORF Transcript_19644/g.59420 Transcript_19644/m.59420 type:complete len:265 (+) Transcript_19644:128-922(+)|eukprot:CAMPEP_0206150740 /NCGR_PEP_ID=MMETSP1473-20131121/38457_1 /ASSEMBLY_ACC=CAM_ASM_001109 /TAXON_ID=1461547 /ORGANISM="Stichococcus sp, Strain RCC1054" /LENGTH=264 /DNA_ID=CAMNT_0053548255 /DNA_START=908 /DNA_END=1702 /DNA_ORIENTATION=-